MRRIEIIVLSLSAFGVFWELMDYPYGGIFALSFLLVFSMLYFYFGFVLFNGIPFRNMFKKSAYSGISTMRIVGSIGTGMALSLTLLGILFKIMVWPLANSNLIVGIVLLTIVFFVCMVKIINKKTHFYKPLLLRVLIFGGIALFLYSNRYLIIELRYSEYPDYIEALIKYDNDPNNIELQEEEEKERKKMRDLEILNVQ